MTPITTTARHAAGFVPPVIVAAALTAALCTGCSTTTGTSADDPVSVTVTTKLQQAPATTATASAAGDGFGKDQPAGDRTSCADTSSGDLIRQVARTIPDRKQPDWGWRVTDDTITPCGGPGYAIIQRLPTRFVMDGNQFGHAETRILFFDGAQFAGMTPPAGNYSISPSHGGDTFTFFGPGNCLEGPGAGTAAGARFRATVTQGQAAITLVDPDVGCSNNLLETPPGSLPPEKLPEQMSENLTSYNNRNITGPVPFEGYSSATELWKFPQADNNGDTTSLFFTTSSGNILCHAATGPLQGGSPLECRLHNTDGATPGQGTRHACSADEIGMPAGDGDVPSAVKLDSNNLPCAWPGPALVVDETTPVAVLEPGEHLLDGHSFVCTATGETMTCTNNGYSFTLTPQGVSVWYPTDTY
ncbi:hypothetical protein ACFSSC_03750 [Corynebacterium mendelii]|uniref:Ig-like domain-containing protein n=1 Tax=Corynebacterium mendelii TaxID=2765362 RepID=A0A939E0V3_9CORY|nr:hypothetical protein [Corynebacterium mendelii]MBN9643482.1 hypothetical protein [Corynebacterium mendelii]